MPANSGLLRIGYRSPGSVFVHFRGENAENLWADAGIFPFSGDRDRRPGFDPHCVADAAVRSTWNIRFEADITLTSSPARVVPDTPQTRGMIRKVKHLAATSQLQFCACQSGPVGFVLGRASHR
jgi:hypothetical protein